MEKLDWDKYFNVFSSAIGDNRHLNPLPQFSPATDPRYGRFLKTREGGMGTMYKELYDDNVTTLTLVAGVPQFAGLLSFLTNMFDPEAAIMANKGRTPSAAFYIGQAAGAIAFWPMQLFSISLQFLQFLSESPKNSFYTVKPAMGSYIMAANGVLNDFMVKLGYINPVLPKTNLEQTDPLHGLKPDYDNSNVIQGLDKLFPDCINDDGTIDLMRLVMRGTRKYRYLINKLAEVDNEAIRTADQKHERLKQLVEQTQFNGNVISGNPTSEYVEREMGTVGKYRENEGAFTETESSYLNANAAENPDNSSIGATTTGTEDGGTTSLQAMINKISSQSYGTNPAEPPIKPQPASPSASQQAAAGTDGYYRDDVDNRSWLGNIGDLIQTALYGGLDAVTFRVENGGSVTDTFSSSMTKSPLADKFNSMVKATNDFKFDLAGGQTGIGIIDSVIQRVTEFGQGALAGTVVGNIPLALANNAYIKVPDHWESSSVNLHRETFTITSRCNYAHPYEQITKIWILMALVLPLVAGFSTGGSSYTSPFMVRAFSKSKTFIRTGMIESARFTLGEGDRGWTRDRKPLNLRIDLEIVDLDPMVSVPIKRGMTLLDMTNPAAALKRMMSDDTAYNNYLARLTGMDYLDTVLKYSRLNRMLTTASLDMKQSFRAANIASKVTDSLVSDVARLFIKPIAR
ncbi:hypothetical protein NFI00_000154 [Salmonella enterica]|nr:hypothetical protein [Salmonella enterica]